jgi:hypothetical protein
MSSPVSSCHRVFFGEDALERLVAGRVVGGSVLSAVPDDVEPGAGEDARGVGVVLAAGDGVVAKAGGSGADAAGVADLGQQPTGADGAGARQGGEDMRVGVPSELPGDLGAQGADLDDQAGRHGQQGAGDAGQGGPVVAGGAAGGGGQLAVQERGVLAAAVALTLQLGGPVDGRRVPGNRWIPHNSCWTSSSRASGAVTRRHLGCISSHSTTGKTRVHQ